MRIYTKILGIVFGFSVLIACNGSTTRETSDLEWIRSASRLTLDPYGGLEGESYEGKALEELLDKFELDSHDDSQMVLVTGCREGVIEIKDKEYPVQYCTKKEGSQSVILTVKKGSKRMRLREK